MTRGNFQPTTFWAKTAIPTEPGGCWIWTARTDRNGYGRFHGYLQGRRTNYAHRYSWELTHEPIPTGLTVDHICRNRSCVNPDHLRLMTQGDNSRAGRNAQREKTHCLRGHPLDGANLYLAPKTGKRNCRACAAERSHHH